MFNRSTQSTVEKAAKRAKKRHAASERAREKRLTETFNKAAKLTKTLTALEAANPKFEFVEVPNANGVDYLTNIPIKSGKHAGEYMEIDVTHSSGYISLTTNQFEGYRDYDAALVSSVKKATKIVAKYIGKNGLGS